MAKKLTQEEFISKAKNVHGDKYSYEDTIYINGRSKIDVNCKIHGNFSVVAKSLLNGEICRNCELNERKNNFIDSANKLHENKYDYSSIKYTTNKIPVDIICPIHGVFKQAPGDHLKG